MKGKITFFIWISAALFSACQHAEIDQKINQQSGETYDVKIVDSLKIEYLGVLNLHDINGKGQYLFHDYQRELYLVIDANGEVINQFVFNPDSKDFSSQPLHGPGFFNDSLLVFNTPKGISFHRYNGDLVSRYSEEGDSNGGIRLYSRGNQQIFKDGKPLVLFKNTQYLAGFDPDEAKYIDGFRALMLFDPFENKLSAHVPIEAQSEYKKSGIFNEPLRMSNSFDVEEEQIAIVYSKDPFVYKYALTKEELTLRETISLDVEIQHLYAKEEYDSRLSGESSVSAVALVDDMVFVQYNPGLPLEQQQEKQSSMEGGSITIRPARNLPKTHFSLFKNGQRVTTKELPESLSRFVLKKDGYLWFSAKPNPDEEEDYITWYKVALAPID